MISFLVLIFLVLWVDNKRKHVHILEENIVFSLLVWSWLVVFFFSVKRKPKCIPDGSVYFQGFHWSMSR